MPNNERVFLVDDNVVNLKIGRQILQDNYTVIPVASGAKLLEMLEKNYAHIILLDIEMPDMDGYEVLEKLKSNPATSDIPVILLAGQNDVDENKGLSLGALDFISKPFSKALVNNRIEHLLLLEQQKRELQDFAKNFSDISFEHKETIEELERAILLWTADLIEFSTGTGSNHQEKMQLCLRVLLVEMLKNDLYADEIQSWDVGIDTIIQAATLHDIGKIRVPDNILQKLKKLDPSEYEQIKQHASHGRTLIENLKERLHNQKFLDYAQTMAFLHHERWDGTGYPLGLEGEDIPLLARAMAIIDVYMALITARVYKDAIPHEEAIEIISAGSGTQFDPELVKLFLSVSNQLK